MLGIWYERDMPDQVRGIVEGLTEPLEHPLFEHGVVMLHAPFASERNCLLLHPNDAVVTPHMATEIGTSKDRLYEGALTRSHQVPRREVPQHLANPEVWPAGRKDPCTKERAT